MYTDDYSEFQVNWNKVTDDHRFDLGLFLARMVEYIN